MPPAGHFLSPATESTQRTPPKPMVLDSLRGRGAVNIGTFCPRELNGANPVPCFRTVPAPVHRDALRACAARPSRENPWVYRLVRCGHRALRNSIAIRCVGAGVLPRPPLPSHPHFCRGGRPCPPALPCPLQNPCHCEAGACTGCGNPHPRPTKKQTLDKSEKKS